MTVQSYVYETLRRLRRPARRKMLELLERALAAQPRATLAISGGTTPKLMFAELAKARFDWSQRPPVLGG